MVTDPVNKTQAAGELFAIYSAFNELIIEPNIAVLNAVITDPAFSRSHAAEIKSQMIEPLQRLNKEFIAIRAAQLKPIFGATTPR